MSDCCLAPTQQFFSQAIWREQVNFQWDDDDVRLCLKHLCTMRDLKKIDVRGTDCQWTINHMFICYLPIYILPSLSTCYRHITVRVRSDHFYLVFFVLCNHSVRHYVLCILLSASCNSVYCQSVIKVSLSILIFSPFNHDLTNDIRCVLIYNWSVQAPQFFTRYDTTLVPREMLFIYLLKHQHLILVTRF